MIRIVKMHFKPEFVEEFIKIFEERKSKILSFEGCENVTLLQDRHCSNIFFTYSIWNDETQLDKYRDSPFFKETWKLTKSLFSEKAAAWSVENVF